MLLALWELRDYRFQTGQAEETLHEGISDMGISGCHRSQFIEVIEWLDDSGNTCFTAFRFKVRRLKRRPLTGARSQAAVFVFRTDPDVFPPGLYTIDGGNTPILSKPAHGFMALIHHSKPRSIS